MKISFFGHWIYSLLWLPILHFTGVFWFGFVLLFSTQIFFLSCIYLGDSQWHFSVLTASFTSMIFFLDSTLVYSFFYLSLTVGAFPPSFNLLSVNILEKSLIYSFFLYSPIYLLKKRSIFFITWKSLQYVFGCKEEVVISF